MAKLAHLVLVICLTIAEIRAQSLNLLLDVEGLGKLQGKETTTQLTKRPYAQFLGIRYDFGFYALGFLHIFFMFLRSQFEL